MKKNSLFLLLIFLFTGQYSFSQLSVMIGNINYEMCGQSNGSAKAFPTGGTSPYTYLWSTSPAQTTQTATGLSAGSYTVTVTDNAASTASASVNINNIPGPSVVISNSTNSSCGLSNGSASCTPSGGSVPYSYSWNSTPPQTSQNLTNVPAGSYTVTVYDNNGCEATATATITNNPPGPSCDITNSVNETNGQSNGSATVTASGGTGSYTYLWNNGQTTATASGLSAGNYSVTVSDGNCTCTDIVTITNISGITDNETNKYFSIYPNPSDGVFTISLMDFTEKDFSIIVFDITGRNVYSEQIACTGSKFEKNIDLNNLSDGIYYLKFVSEEKVFTRKITVE